MSATMPAPAWAGVDPAAAHRPPPGSPGDLSSPWVYRPLRAAALFDGLAAADVDAVVGRFEFVRFGAGDTILQAGDEYEYFMVVVAGEVHLLSPAPKDRHVMTSLLRASEQFGELAVLPGVASTVTARAVSPAMVARIRGAELRRWTELSPQRAAGLLRVVAREWRRADARLADRLSDDVATRVGKQLLVLGERFGHSRAGHVWIMHGLTQDELGQLVGASRGTVNRVLANFARRGWISLEKGGVAILDPAGLARRCGYERVSAGR